jgi:hypothetical protein
MECSMHGMRGVIADGHDVGGAGGSKGRLMRARFFARGQCQRPLRRGPGLGWLEGSPIVGGTTAVSWVTTVGGAKTVGGATTARGSVGSTVGTLRTGALGRLERWQRGPCATMVHSEAMGP